MPGKHKTITSWERKLSTPLRARLQPDPPMSAKPRTPRTHCEYCRKPLTEFQRSKRTRFCCLRCFRRASAGQPWGSNE